MKNTNSKSSKNVFERIIKFLQELIESLINSSQPIIKFFKDDLRKTRFGSELGGLVGNCLNIKPPRKGSKELITTKKRIKPSNQLHDKVENEGQGPSMKQ